MKAWLGYTYTDLITGFTGVCTGRCEYLTGCNQALIHPGIEGETNKHVDARWFDEQRLKLKEFRDPIVLDNGNTPGFYVKAPIR